MRVATLIVNGAAGRARLLRYQLEAIEAELLQHDLSARVVYTSADPDSAQALATAAACDSDLVLAAGGDGTVHGVLQGLAGTAVPLGVIPLGTANALARNLGLPLDPLAATTRLLGFRARRVPLGRAVSAAGSRFFLLMAGCGPDGALVHLLSQPGVARLKARFGRSAYYAHAARLFMTRRWPSFRVEFRESPSAPWQSLEAIAVLCSRVPDLGGLFTGAAPEASLLHDRLLVQLVRPPGELSLPAWMLGQRFRVANPWLRTVEATELRCTPGRRRPVYAQADAEPLGALPLTLSLVPDALSLLLPPDPA